ncbi:hypothetical protein L3056_10480 [Corynebacterium sp. MC-25]|nr:hypothetical protein [Corynebacterium parakroppenstedtii]MCF8706138.1 hypothetical protein [Corynebacterium parakroppenstedtii]PMC65757.1 hypothetical protein CJ202_09735 [Corynebacterium kroppenstedtii]
MSKTSRWILSIPVAISLPLVSPAPAFSAETKNELGMYTVKCQVVKNGPGNPKVGLIYGNHPKSAKKAEKDADLYTNKFGKNAHKRHCQTQTRYKNSGAFTVDGDPI